MGNKVTTPNFNISRNSRKKRRKRPHDGKYLIEVTDIQIDRIQQMHHVLKTCCKGNFFAPISKDLKRGIKVLDIGSGPGTWIFDMSSEFSKSEFIGVEMQAFMLPTVHPSNTQFIHNNILEGIPFSPGTFDYIFMRNMTLCFTEQQYEQIIRDLINLLKPNGYLELCEPEMCSSNMGPASEIISTNITSFLRSRGMNPFINEQLGELLTQFGLRDVEEKPVDLPISELDGKIGKLYGELMMAGLKGMKDILAIQMNISKTAVDTLIEEYCQETRSRRMYGRFTRCYGKKFVKPQE